MSQQQQRQFQMGGSSNAEGASFGDTTYTKIFVGGLAWETHRETMKHYFEQFGEILEAVVITDKNTGRSKGYGFVTFKDPEAAKRACQDPSPVIDGRRANCNIASFGAAQRTRPPTPQHGMGRHRPDSGSTPPSYSGAGSTYFHQPSQYPWYSGYSQENMYPMTYYNNAFGGSQFSPYYTMAGSGYYQNFYPYYAQYSQTNQAAQGTSFGMPYFVQYPYMQQQLATGGAGILSLPSTAPSTAGGQMPGVTVSGSSSIAGGGTISTEQSNRGA